MIINHSIQIIEGLCYLHPHKREIVQDHPSMRGVWRTVFSMQKDPTSFVAPLLVDDLEREASPTQSIESILKSTIGKKYSDLTWFADPVMESEIAQKYDAFGCKEYDALYHRDILLSVMLISADWKWIVVHPDSFTDQQSGMLEDLWHLIMPSGLKLAPEVRAKLRDDFLAHFKHYWIDDRGVISMVTVPRYNKKKIEHHAA